MQAVRAERAVRGRGRLARFVREWTEAELEWQDEDLERPFSTSRPHDRVRRGEGSRGGRSEPKAAIINNDKPPTLHRRDTAHLNREQRLWANYHDVFSVEESLRRDLQMVASESETVAAFVRDVLNSADRVEHWQRIASFAVAVALAQERVTGRPLTDATERVVGVLDQWCASYSKDDVRPEYRPGSYDRTRSSVTRARSTSATTSFPHESWRPGCAVCRHVLCKVLMTRSATPSSEALNAASRYHWAPSTFTPAGRLKCSGSRRGFPDQTACCARRPLAVAGGGVRHIARGNPCRRWSLPTQIGVE